MYLQDIYMNAFNFPQRAYELSAEITTSEWLSRCYYTLFKDHRHFGIGVCDKDFEVSLHYYFNYVQFSEFNKYMTFSSKPLSVMVDKHLFLCLYRYLL